MAVIVDLGPFTVVRIGPWCGLSSAQRIALARAVEAGYYSIPREISTNELAAEFGITDQAVTERLRRGIKNFVTSTLLLSEDKEEGTVSDKRTAFVGTVFDQRTNGLVGTVMQRPRVGLGDVNSHGEQSTTSIPPGIQVCAWHNQHLVGG